MEFPELSLAPSHLSNYESHEINLPMKRKQDMIQASVDLQLKDPLPLDWEQCLDLEVYPFFLFPNFHFKFDLFILISLSYIHRQYKSLCIVYTKLNPFL